MPTAQFPLLTTFNRYGIERCGKDLVIHLGFANQRQILSAFCFVLDLSYFEAARENWRDYCERVFNVALDTDSDEVIVGDFRCNPADLRSPHLATINHINWHQRGDLGELKLYVLSLGDIFEAERGEGDEKSVAAQPVALARSSLSHQIALLTELL